MPDATTTTIHPLLARQLKRAGIKDPTVPPDAEAWEKLLGRVSRAYQDGDQERYTLERSLQISSQEMQSLYEDLRNTSESRLAEETEKLRAVVSAIGDGLCVLDEHGELAFANKAAASLLGCSEKDLIGDRILELFDARQPAAGTESLYARMAESGTVRVDDATLTRPSGDTLPVSLVVNPIEESGGVRGAVLVFRDMTPTRQIHEQLDAARRHAEDASRAKSEFLATMSHEIRTPMNGVIGMISLLRETSLTPQQRSYIETVMSSGNALLSIINDILDFSKIEADKLTIESIEFDLPQIVDEVVDLFADTAAARGLGFDCRIDPTVPLRVRGDPGRLRQVMNNLVSNAIKFTASGTVSLHVRSERQGERELVAITVADTGRGIPEDKQGLLFQAFSQTDSSTTREFGGTGLGLAISKRLCQLMGGDIHVTSEVGHGTSFEFTVELPACEPVVRAGAQNVDGVPITLVDGADTPLLALAARLRALGFRTNVAASFDDALDALGMDPDGRKLLALPLDEHAPQRLEALADADLADVGVLFTRARGTPCDADEVAEDPHFAAEIQLPARASHLQDVLPRLLPEADAHEERCSARRPVVTGGPPSRVLLVEDNMVNQKVAKAMLERLGHTVHVAGNGLEALAAVQRGPFDLVLMDCQMPEMDGLEATVRIRENEPDAEHVPIVAMTANALKGTREECLAAGMDDYLSKPVRYEELAHSLATWLPKTD